MADKDDTKQNPESDEAKETKRAKAAKKAKPKAKKKTTRKPATKRKAKAAPRSKDADKAETKPADEAKPAKAKKAKKAKKAVPAKVDTPDDGAKQPAGEDAPQKPAPKKAAGAVHLLTGFPGFIGTRLVKKLALEDPAAQFVLLVEARILARAETALKEVDSEIKGFADRAQLVTGDITRESLGIEPGLLGGILERVTTAWHLAAIYDLAVEAQFAYRVNVVGTSNVLDFCEACKSFDRLNYISTCYVSGDRTGLILESELDEGQGHKNHYERTKFWAEVEVRRRMDHLPTSIFRPGIVVGDSQSGETDKYDGPYYLINFLLRLPDWLPMVNVGRGDALVNLVPVDFVVDALVSIAAQKEAAGKTFQVADPNPMRARDIISLTLKILGRRPAIATVPPKLFLKLLDYRRLRRMIGMPPESVIYFNHLARYDVTHTLEHLADTPTRCPHLSTYLSTLVDYVKRNPKKTFLDGREL